MRACEFCESTVDETTNKCTSCGAAQSARSAAPQQAAPAPHVHTPQPNAGNGKSVSHLWMIWCFIPVLSGIGIVWIGKQAKQNAWLKEGAFYMLPLLIAMFSGDDPNYPTDGQNSFNILIWIACIIRAFMLKPKYEAIMQGRSS
jgi:hypothetical protein